MRRITDISEIHKIILDIAAVFHDICVRHGIPYYMLGGTMLGTIRHGGFIPWDDDMDFGVPRVYYDKLVKILKKELPKHLVCLTPLDDYGIPNEIIKISDMRTVVDEQNKEHISKKMGLFIDIFPLDFSNNNWNRWSRNWIISTILNLNNLRYYPTNTTKGRFLHKVIKLIPKQFYLKTIKYLTAKQGEYYSNYSGAWGSRETILYLYFGKPVLYEFDGIMLYGVQDPHQYLTCLYGNWEELPSEDNRHFHLVNVFYI